MNSLLFKRIVVFIITFFAYASFHISRKSMSNVKYSLKKQWGLSTIVLGALDTTFLVCYSVGLFISGQVGDRIHVVRLVAAGMWLSGICVSLFGFAYYMEIHSEYYFGVVWGLTGLFQSAGWPCCVAIMGNWFDKSRGGIYGLWSSNISIGNILGAVLASICLSASLGWQSPMIISGLFIIVWGLIVFIFLKAHPPPAYDTSSASYSERTPLVPPQEVIYSSTPTTPSEAIINNEESRPHNSPPSINFFQAWLIPGVFVYAISNAFIKLVSYAFLLWLPYYLTSALHEKESLADLLSTLYDIGGMLGGILFGFVSDFLYRRKGGRSLVIVPMMLLSCLAFYFYRFEGHQSRALNCTLMTICGMFVNGAYNIISSAISADLGTHKLLQGNASAMSTVTGIIDGTGSAGAAVGQILVAWISEKWGWDGVFYMLMLCTVLSALCLSHLFVKEVRQLLSNHRHPHEHE
jgi:OPA family glycerol-3-phosphate transporter-like MFS transporter 1/2